MIGCQTKRYVVILIGTKIADHLAKIGTSFKDYVEGFNGKMWCLVYIQALEPEPERIHDNERTKTRFPCPLYSKGWMVVGGRKYLLEECWRGKAAARSRSCREGQLLA